MDKSGKPIEFLEHLRADIDGKDKRMALTFGEFLEVAQAEPQRVLRNIFQLFYDMIKGNIVKGEDEYPGDPESIGFVPYDCSSIFVENADSPFFPDRLLANRFAREIETLKQGSQQNRIYVYYGPPGSGKSTFLNNLLQKLERYVDSPEGRSYEIFWGFDDEGHRIEIPCPSHDHPALLVPKDYRADFLSKLLSSAPAEIRRRIIGEKDIPGEKEYEWLLEAKTCTICESIFQASCEKFGFDKTLEMVKVRPYRFNRRIGEGISIFNPGDKPLSIMYLENKPIQEALDRIFPGRVRYVYSQLAKTNNGVYVLMDIKSHNLERLLELHNVISEGVHKVDGIVEEQVNSLFFALMNPEDIDAVEGQKVESLKARMRKNKIPYVMEVATEVRIYRSVCGGQIDSYFLPHVLDNFARAIIASRMKFDLAPEADPLKAWIPSHNWRPYVDKKYCDEFGLLLRMEIYGGIIPTWLSEEDKKGFTAQKRRDLIAEAANEGEGDHGFSGRHSIDCFKEFLALYGPEPGERNITLINMDNVVDYFKNRLSREYREIRDKHLPKKLKFFESLIDWYDYAVLNEVKEALYFYNKEQIREDVLHYLCAINYDADGRVIKCQYTGKEVEVTIEFLKLVGSYIAGESMSDREAIRLAKEHQGRYVEMIAQNSDKPITDTDLYKELFGSYVRNLKENALKPFIENENFRRAIKAFGSQEFESFDTRIKEHVAYMINNLIRKFGYTEQGAKEVCLYVVDKNLVKKFPK